MTWAILLVLAPVLLWLVLLGHELERLARRVDRLTVDVEDLTHHARRGRP